jgi:hypothetical protein
MRKCLRLFLIFVSIKMQKKKTLRKLKYNKLPLLVHANLENDRQVLLLRNGKVRLKIDVKQTAVPDLRHRFSKKKTVAYRINIAHTTRYTRSF